MQSQSSLRSSWGGIAHLGVLTLLLFISPGMGNGATDAAAESLQGYVFKSEGVWLLEVGKARYQIRWPRGREPVGLSGVHRLFSEVRGAISNGCNGYKACVEIQEFAPALTHDPLSEQKSRIRRSIR